MLQSSILNTNKANTYARIKKNSLWFMHGTNCQNMIHSKTIIRKHTVNKNAPLSQFKYKFACIYRYRNSFNMTHILKSPAVSRLNAMHLLLFKYT